MLLNSMLSLRIAALLANLTLLLGSALPIQPRQAVHNNFLCKSAVHPNPVVLLHGLGATYYEDINFLESYLQSHGYCTFSLTYGAYDQFPYVGGLKPIKDSSQEIVTFLKQVKDKTGAKKIDLLGHSEGAFLTLYVTKFGGVSSFIGRVFAIAPPSHGTTFSGLYNFAYIGGNLTASLTKEILNTVGCAACADLGPTGDAVAQLNNGSIAQSGVTYTILTSKYDELVTPPAQSSFVREPGVQNLFIQDFCPADPVGHIGEAYDMNTFVLVDSALTNTIAGPAFCSYGSPGK